MIVVPKGAGEPSKQSINDFLRDKVVKWWLPDDIVFVDEIPHTATGKIQKARLREQYRDHFAASGGSAINLHLSQRTTS